MEQTVAKGISGSQEGDVNNGAAVAPSGGGSTRTALSPQAEGGTCHCGGASGKCSCGGAGSNPNGGGAMTYAYVYALGRIEPRFPRLAVEKEFAQATGRAPTAGLTDRQALHAVLSHRRTGIWCGNSAGSSHRGPRDLILQPRDPVDFDLLVEALRPAPRAMDVDVVIGVRGPIAQPELCNGLMVPILAFEHIYSFDLRRARQGDPAARRDTGQAIRDQRPRNCSTGSSSWRTTLGRPMNTAPSTISPSATRPSAPTAERDAKDNALTAVEVRPSTLSGTQSRRCRLLALPTARPT